MVASSSSNNPNVESGNAQNGADVYDKLRILNGSQPWSTHHPSAWYMPAHAAAAAAVAASFMGGASSGAPPGSPGSAAQAAYMLAHQQHGQLDMIECKKGSCEF